MVALPWQQGEARGTLNLPASTKVEDLKLCLNASDCAAVMFDAVIIEVRKEVFSELPENWNKFKRPELRDVTACVFDSIQGQLLAGAAALDTRGLHQALVDLGDRDATSPPIEARSEAFVQAVRAAQLALAPDAVGASSFREGPAYSDAHVHSVILQAVILPCLERIVHSIGIELLSIFFLGVFAIALSS